MFYWLREPGVPTQVILNVSNSSNRELYTVKCEHFFYLPSFSFSLLRVNGFFSLWIYTHKYIFYINENNLLTLRINQLDSPFPTNTKLWPPEHKPCLWLYPNASLRSLAPIATSLGHLNLNVPLPLGGILGFLTPYPRASFSYTCDSPEPSSSKKYLTMVPSAWPERIPFPEQLKKEKRRKGKKYRKRLLFHTKKLPFPVPHYPAWGSCYQSSPASVL